MPKVFFHQVLVQVDLQDPVPFLHFIGQQHEIAEVTRVLPDGLVVVFDPGSPGWRGLEGQQKPGSFHLRVDALAFLHGGLEFLQVAVEPGAFRRRPPLVVADVFMQAALPPLLPAVAHAPGIVPAGRRADAIDVVVL
ncbi:MAG: hypothetical protein ACOX8T_10685 [Bacillota bacterium]